MTRRARNEACLRRLYGCSPVAAYANIPSPSFPPLQEGGCCLQIPNDTIIILLGLVFCCVNPLVCPAALMYFLITWTLEKYNMLYVWRENYQTGGKVRLVLTILQASHCMQQESGPQHGSCCHPDLSGCAPETVSYFSMCSRSVLVVLLKLIVPLVNIASYKLVVRICHMNTGPACWQCKHEPHTRLRVLALH